MLRKYLRVFVKDYVMILSTGSLHKSNECRAYKSENIIVSAINYAILLVGLSNTYVTSDKERFAIVICLEFLLQITQLFWAGFIDKFL